MDDSEKTMLPLCTGTNKKRGKKETRRKKKILQLNFLLGLFEKQKQDKDDGRLSSSGLELQLYYLSPLDWRVTE